MGRHHTEVPTEHYVLTCYRYIELNPVRAGRALIELPLSRPMLEEIRKATRNGQRLGNPSRPRSRSSGEPAKGS